MTEKRLFADDAAALKALIARAAQECGEELGGALSAAVGSARRGVGAP